MRHCSIWCAIALILPWEDILIGNDKYPCYWFKAWQWKVYNDVSWWMYKWLTACLSGSITVSLIYRVCILLNPAGETAPSLLSEHISSVPCTECWIPRDDVRSDCCPATQDSGRDGETSSLSQKVKCLFSYHRDDFCVILVLFVCLFWSRFCCVRTSLCLSYLPCLLLYTCNIHKPFKLDVHIVSSWLLNCKNHNGRKKRFVNSARSLFRYV